MSAVEGLCARELLSRFFNKCLLEGEIVTSCCCKTLWCLYSLCSGLCDSPSNHLCLHTFQVNLQPCPLHEPQKIISLNISNQVGIKLHDWMYAL